MPPGGELGWEAMAGPMPYPFSMPFYRFHRVQGSKLGLQDASCEL